MFIMLVYPGFIIAWLCMDYFHLNSLRGHGPVDRGKNYKLFRALLPFE